MFAHSPQKGSTGINLMALFAFSSRLFTKFDKSLMKVCKTSTGCLSGAALEKQPVGQQTLCEFSVNIANFVKLCTNLVKTLNPKVYSW